LRRILEEQIKISEENARIFIAQMNTILEIAEEINCPDAAEMRRIHDLEAHPILTSVFPKMREKLAQRFM
jgi:Asp-tRNA(Asn)/Glu-tRNA(Gln) amidotransferase C subunit